MSPLLKKLLTIFLIICFGISSIMFFASDTTNISEDVKATTAPTTKSRNISKSKPESKHNASIPDQAKPKSAQKPNTAEGVNPIFRDKPETQIAWMQRGKSVVIKNKTDADAADFRNTFFHRGSNARPVTCGEVQFRAKGEVIDDYQRFIFTGIQSSYLELNVRNFDKFWSIMCEQTLEEYFEQ